MKPAVLAILTDAYGAGGGIAQYNRDWIEAASMLPAEVHVCCYTRQSDGHFQVPPNVNIRIVTKSRWRMVWESVRASLNVRPSVVFCGHLHLLPAGILAARIVGAPLWVQAHGVEAWVRPGRLSRSLIETASLITAVSRHTRRQLLSWAAIAPRVVRVLPNTVSDQFVPGARDNEYAKSIGVHGRPTLLTVGRLDPAERYKGHDRLIDCLPSLLETHPDLQYVIAGSGDDMPRLKSRARDLGVFQSVLFMGEVAQSQLPKLYNLADLFVMPSTGEGFGIAYLEALACNVPAIGLNLDGSVDPLSLGAGTSVAPIDLGSALAAALGAHRPQSNGVHEVQDRFGQSSFRRHIGMLLEGFTLNSSDRQLQTNRFG